MRKRKSLIFGSAVSAMLIATTLQMNTADAADVAASKAMKTVDQGPDVELSATQKQPDGSRLANQEGGTVSVPASSGEPVRLVSTSGSAVDVSLPSDTDVAGRAMSSSTVVYPDASSEGSVAAQSTADGFRAVITIDGPSAPTTFEYPVDLPDEGWMELGEDGAVQIYDANADPVGGFTKPWAVDADGNSLPTSYEIRGDVLVQHVQHQGAAYPVAADPQFTWGWVTGTLYFDRSETNTATTAAGLSAILGGICAGSIATGPFAIAICTGAGAQAGVIGVMANHYYNTNRCLKLKIPTFEPGSVRMGDRNCR